MSNAVPDPAGAPEPSFETLHASLAAHGATRGWRLQGRSADGRSLLLDLAGVTGTAAPPQLLHAARLRRGAGASTGAGAGIGTAAAQAWSLESTEGRFDAGAARLFVHEDVAARAAAAIPPRAVPLGKRLMWRAVFALLATSFGRRWLARRAGLA